MSISNEPDDIFGQTAGLPDGQQPLESSTVGTAQRVAEDQFDGDDVDSEEDEDQEDADLQRRFLLFHATPAWVVSSLVHALILLILGLITLANPEQLISVLTATNGADDGPEIEEISFEDPEMMETEDTEETEEEVEITEPVETVEEIAFETPIMDVTAVPLEVADFATDMAPTAMTLQSMSNSSQPMGSRSESMKKKLLREYGGTEASEAAVTEALKWLTRHQIKVGPQMGAWTFQHDAVCGTNCGCGNGCEPNRRKQLNAATSMALLPFMGAGQTHLKGEYRQVVHAGLRFLVRNGKPGRRNGIPYVDYRGPGGNMYDHGLAAITLCEAYAMTGDAELAAPAQAALNFIALAQYADGGWRYGPEGSGGDTSVVGWQVMALKSGHMGHLAIPQNVFTGASLFLDKVSSDSGSIYGYAGPSATVRPATTAVGLLCRMYGGWDKSHPGIQKGVSHLAKTGVLKNNLYYNYYAVQVLRHHGGSEWDKFNTELRDWLVETQAQQPGAKGSWFFPNNGHVAGAGRLCSTSFACMILEVYYRHMPLYAEKVSEAEFQL